MKRKLLPIICLFIFTGIVLQAQTHSSVQLDNQVYYILEQAETRGLCSALSGTRPYTRSIINEKIDEILNSGKAEKLKATEREVLEQYLTQFSKPQKGMDWRRGAYYAETAIGKNEAPLSMNVGVSADLEGSLGIYVPDERYYGAEIWLGGYLNGDLGRNVSYDFTFEGGLVRAPRKYLGKYNTYYEGFPDEEEAPNDEFVNQLINVSSEPLTHFPYTYKKHWDSSVFFFHRLNGYDAWPDDFAGAYSLPAELSASFLENKLTARLGRISHEWGCAPSGSSLALNQMARPFLAFEAEFNPVQWFGITSMTGILEYSNTESIKDSAMSFQNAFSVTMMQFRFKNYLCFDFIDAVVYPKRFELGYISPITNSFFYQNNIGDFDNMAITLNLKAQYPGVGALWFSFFVDEMNLISDWWLDRQMVAVQLGLSVPLPILSFSTLKFSYTKVNPYCYTHNRNFNPWHSDIRMETAYVNNGMSLGYYLPPNADEILLKYQTMPAKNINTYMQYQLIRHGADFGSNAVDGSNLRSELGNERNDNPILRRFFLHDGAYQWMHIVRLGADWKLSALPISLFGEAGVNYSFFTNIAEEANVTGKSQPYSTVDTSEYPKSTGIIISLGVKVFPR